MATRTKRRGVQTVPLYSHIAVETKGVIDAIAAATGCHKNVVIEAIVRHIECDERGVPTWWEGPVAGDQPEELDLRAS
ncbi:MAG: hypothetical protein L0H79_06945 [Intrasporangium sp.]|uniref:hypothetical protein n=1 Tax=Intrasporangium sp. TaxID=1925024 RepID=UPI0026486110|nr:hypothetical protein [Intrasporangium sp.]MDN5795475.1 hypothetical protein [Intrasporangium sp.]